MFASRTFFGSGGIVSPLPGGTAAASVFSPGTALASLDVRLDGAVIGSGNDASFSHAWFEPIGGTPGNSYWVRATVTSGSLSGGDATGAWLALSSNRNWNRARSAPGISSAALLIEIASDAAGANVVTSGNYTLQASVEI